LITGLTAGTYYLRIVPVAGDTATTPSVINIVLAVGDNSTENGGHQGETIQRTQILRR
jgi:hypothetical protein